MRPRHLIAVLPALCALLLPAVALGHAERQSYFPNHRLGSVPKVRSTGPSIVVCRPESARLITRQGGRIERRNRALLRRCKFNNIQPAVNRARNRTRILLLPGTYPEYRSRRASNTPRRCESRYKERPADSSEGIGAIGNDESSVPSYRYHRVCPNAKNLIAITGDDFDRDRRCDDKCGIQLLGMGRSPREVLISGCTYDRRSRRCARPPKQNVIRADRADGVVLRNFMVQYSDFNNIYVHETNGFRVEQIHTRWSREYGALSFTSDNGLYNGMRAHGNGDSGVYPGSGPEGHCKRYGIEIRRVNSFNNVIGYSGTAGNGVWAHDNWFHHNNAGITTDSFASGHPGMPQDCAKFEDNRIYSNNRNYFTEARDEYCQRPPHKRNPRVVCPAFQVPVGTGLLIAGGNGNIVRDNWIYDNWRIGAMLFYVPAAARGEDDPAKQRDTSFNNKFLGNRMGLRPARRKPVRRRSPVFVGRLPGGTRDPNGLDFWWDGQGTGNCWRGNTAGPTASVTYDPPPPLLPQCPALTPFAATGDPSKLGFLAPCATWEPGTNDDPPGCRTEGTQPGNNSFGWRQHWFDTPPEPAP